MGQANIDRGEKWTKAMKEAEFENRPADVEWMKSQKSVMDDIKEYEFFTKYPEALKKHIEEYNRLEEKTREGERKIYDKLVKEYTKKPSEKA